MQHLAACESDHCFVVADVQASLPGRSQHTRQFRYEKVWQTHRDYDQLVSETWCGHARAPGLQGISDSLDILRRTLGPWGAKEFGCLAKKIKKIQ